MRRIAAAVAFGLCLALLGPTSRSRSEIVGLKRGDVIHGTILSSDENALKIRTFDGAELLVPWEAVAPSEMERLKKGLGLLVAETDGAIHSTGVRLTLPSEEIVAGVVQSETAEEIVVKRADGVRRYPKSTLQAIERDVEIEALEAYTPKELYRKYIEDNGAPAIAEEHFKACDYARRIGAYDEALDHLKKCAEVDPDWKPEVVKAQREGVEKILASVEARGLFEKIRGNVRAGQFNAALAQLDEFLKRFPGSPILADIEKEQLTKEKIVERKKQYLRSRISADWIAAVQKLLRDKVREKDLSFQEAKNWTERDLSEQASKKVAEKLAIDAGGVKELWSGRRALGNRQASYGTGTFLVEKLKLKKTPQPAGGGPRRRPTSQSQQQDQGPKKPTPEDWWKEASPDTRYEWLLAYYAEKTKALEVMRVQYSQCGKCSGRGYLSVLGQTGDSVNQPCDRCWQLGKDRVVVFR